MNYPFVPINGFPNYAEGKCPECGGVQFIHIKTIQESGWQCEGDENENTEDCDFFGNVKDYFTTVCRKNRV